MGAVGAQFAPEPPALFHGRPLFSDFGAQREPKRVPKWSQNHKKAVQRSLQTSMRFLRDLWSVVG